MTVPRATIALDPDVAEQLEALARQRHTSFEAALNDALRDGLALRRGNLSPYRVVSRPMGLRPGIDLTRAMRLAESIEDEEIVRKLEPQK